LRDPGDVISAAFAAIFAVLNAAMSIVSYRWGLQAAELPEAEEAVLTPEERYALHERMQKRMNRWRIAAFGHVQISPFREGRERDARSTSQEEG